MVQRISPTPISVSVKPAASGRPRRLNLSTALLLLLLAVVLAFAAWSFSNYRQAQQKITQLSTPEGQQELAKEEIAQLTALVGKLIVLPADEEPVVATILDIEKLSKDQPFYRNAKNGDKVLIYIKAQQAIIYDTVRNILVNVGPVSVQGSGSQAASAPAQPAAEQPAAE